MNGLNPAWRLPDPLWQEIKRMLPTPKPKPRGGRPRMDDRRAADAIFYILRTGCQWKALPRCLGASSTVYDRFREWHNLGLFKKLWQKGLRKYDQTRTIDWTWQAVDGCMTKAPLGGEKNRTQPHRPSQIRHQEKPPHRWQGNPSRLGRRRRKPTRQEDAARHHRLHRHRTTRAHPRKAPASLLGQGIRLLRHPRVR
jgi:transposase